MGNGKSPIAIACWDICSIAGKRRKNDDYALFDAYFGGCLADGIGKFPIADAVSRYACHTAFDCLKEGVSAHMAIRCAQAKIAEFVKAAGTPESGTAITVLRMGRGEFEVSWLGDVACYVLRAGEKYLRHITMPHRCGNRLTRLAGSAPFEPDEAAFLTQSGDRIVLCTDGVWDELPESEILQSLAETETPQEACAKLVLGRQPNDDATAIAVFVS